MLNLIVEIQSPLLIQISVYLLAFITLCILGYYLLGYLRFVIYKAKRPPLLNRPISVVVYAKNDAQNLQQTLPEYLSQEYENFEVVVVDDHSYDDTATVMEEFLKHHKNLKFVDMKSSITHIKGRKYPLSIAIKESANEHILFTSADAMPASKYWLQKMASRFSEKKQIVLGYGTYSCQKGFFNLLLHYDKFFDAMQYFSLAAAKHPVFGRGQNIAYTKSLFLKNKGFSSHYHITYGEDDLFINQIANKNNCTIEYSADAQTIIQAPSSVSFWLWNKRAHFSTRHYYHKGDRFLLDFYGVLAPFFYLAFAFALYTSWLNYLWIIIASSIFLVKTVAMYIIFGINAKKMNEKRVIPYILLFDFFFSFLNLLLYFVSKLSNQK